MHIKDTNYNLANGNTFTGDMVNIGIYVWDKSENVTTNPVSNQILSYKLIMMKSYVKFNCDRNSRVFLRGEKKIFQA